MHLLLIIRELQGQQLFQLLFTLHASTLWWHVRDLLLTATYTRSNLKSFTLKHQNFSLKLTNVDKFYLLIDFVIKNNEICSPPTNEFNELIGIDKKNFFNSSLCKVWDWNCLIDYYLIQSQINVNSIEISLKLNIRKMFA